ncbi:hypothetical protein MACH09_33140 [Vibrio sp. MACH09]|uniref:TetR/AcrR family transcriptional regulator n=1 Tax=Vibrio sp. MACH09 TaxID=3025122 RepID=UPI002794F98D|nr:TetR/AcrR family transcriptional regulator [Vibrio sp. MACH09]GLO62806.1 hypothetical protein MACH09_33140 [Vibrio sp. MACH09]
MRQSKEETVARIKDAMTSLSQHSNINKLSIYDIASEARMSSSTIYHHYPNVEVLLYEMMENVFSDFISVVRNCLSGVDVQHWRDINREVESSLIEYCDSHPLAKKILYSQHPYLSIQEAAKKNDLILGQEIENLYRNNFKLPTLPTHINIFIVALEAGDSLYFSHNEEGKPVSNEIIHEARILTERYLSYYLPEYLPKIE